jgi:hypothetical protein
LKVEKMLGNDLYFGLKRVEEIEASLEEDRLVLPRSRNVSTFTNLTRTPVLEEIISNVRRTEGGVRRIGTRRRSMRGIRKLARVWRTSELVPPREEDQGNVFFFFFL